jgi:hypothetical protein
MALTLSKSDFFPHQPEYVSTGFPPASQATDANAFRLMSQSECHLANALRLIDAISTIFCKVSIL